MSRENVTTLYIYKLFLFDSDSLSLSLTLFVSLFYPLNMSKSLTFSGWQKLSSRASNLTMIARFGITKNFPTESCLCVIILWLYLAKE